MRLIDADELLKKQTTMTDYDEGGWDWPVSVVLAEDIKNAPAIDPEELRPRGRWIEITDSAFETYYDCSECGESFYLAAGAPFDNLYRYCPNCGAKMEGLE